MEGAEVERRAETLVRISSETCDVCSRRHGGYYESIVQIRRRDRRLSAEEVEAWRERVVDMMAHISLHNRQVFISRMEDMHGGLDVYLSTTDAGKQMARQIAREYGASVKESGSLAGRRDGRDFYRSTFSVRLPPYERGDFIALGERVYRVLRITRDSVHLLDLSTGEEMREKRDIDDRLDYLGGEEAVVEGVVVYDGGDEVQIMEPGSYKTLQIKKPAHFSAGEGESVPIIFYRDRVFVV